MASGPKDRWDKADIVGKWVTGLIGSALLLLLSYCVNQSSQRIANAQKNAALVADLIKDLSDTTRVRKELALIALSYAVPKDESAAGASDLVAKVCEHMLLTGYKPTNDIPANAATTFATLMFLLVAAL